MVSGHGSWKVQKTISTSYSIVTKFEEIRSGIYILELSSKIPFRVSHPKFLEYRFNAGFYYYVGSSQRSIQKRVLRHLRKRKNIHWHIDYLTSLNNIYIDRIFILPKMGKQIESKLAVQMENYFNLDTSIIGFGNTDDKLSKTHLFYSKEKIDHNHLFSLYQSMVCFIPSSSDTF
jgi:sugar fermentation stimulation protein A